MSKAQLKKLLHQMTAEDVADLVLQLYDARKEAKDFLEFFVNPDIESKQEKCVAALDKEILRTKRNTVNMRFSRIKETLKHFASYGPDSDQLATLYVNTFSKLVFRGASINQTATYRNGMRVFLKQVFAAVQANGMRPAHLEAIDKIIQSINTAYYDNRQLRNDLTETFTDCLNQSK